jgi:hypothetical protein
MSILGKAPGGDTPDIPKTKNTNVHRFLLMIIISYVALAIATSCGEPHKTLQPPANLSSFRGEFEGRKLLKFPIRVGCGP